MTTHSEAESQRVSVGSVSAFVTDRQIDTALIGNNSLHLMHSMQPKMRTSHVVLLCASYSKTESLHVTGCQQMKLEDQDLEV